MTPKLLTPNISCITDIVDFVYITRGRRPIVLCGDFNDLRHRYSELCSLTHLKCVVNFPTRQDHILDQVFVNFASSHPAIQMPPTGSSDHYVVSWSPSPSQKIPVLKKVIRKFSVSKLLGFKHFVSDVNWCRLDGLDDSVSSFVAQLVALFDHFFQPRLFVFGLTTQSG